MADQFAANGYFTLIVDMFNGDPMKLNNHKDFDFMSWMQNGTNGDNPHTYKYIDPIIEKSIAYLKNKGFKKIGSVGYCFVSSSTVLSQVQKANWLC
jgi:dienelactone hydrolase